GKKARPLTLSICVDDEDLSDFVNAFTKANPFALDWADRRPIIQMATDDRRARETTLRVMALEGINACLNLPGQLVLYHGLEGMDDASGLKYMGCPELLDQIRSDKLDGLIALHKQAKVDFGFCIRPWVLARVGRKWEVDKSISPEEALDRKLAFLSGIG